MKNTGALQVTTPTEREIVMTRVFDAPRRLVWDAHTRCELLKRWLFGPGDWSLAVCEVDLTVGGRYRYVWRHPEKKEMGMGGVFREIVPPERLVATEKFDDSWYPGEAVNTLVLTEKGGKTTMTLALLYESRQARDVALKSGMEKGMEMGFDRLDKIFASAQAHGSE
ncbi:MAG: SRPBCC family protein [Candidatus Acidiferrales bacterium]